MEKVNEVVTVGHREKIVDTKVEETKQMVLDLAMNFDVDLNI